MNEHDCAEADAQLLALRGDLGALHMNAQRNQWGEHRNTNRLACTPRNCTFARVLADTAPAAEEAVAQIAEPWRHALGEAWAVIDFLAPPDEPVFGSFRESVQRVVEARRAAVALLPQLDEREEGK